MLSLSDALARLRAASHLDAAAALELRRAIFLDGSGVSASEAEALIELNDGAEATAPEWQALYIEALTDFIVRQQTPQGYVDQEKSDWILRSILRDGVVKGDTELELLIRILEISEASPDSLAAAALSQCVVAVRAPDLDAPRVDAAEVALLKRVLYAGGGAAGIGVSRPEAEALVQINDACRGGDNAPEWRHLFVRGVANAILVATTYQAPSAQEALRREAWLNDINDIDFASLLTRPLRETLRIAFQRDEDAWAERLAAEDAARARAHVIEPAEWDWVRGLIGRDGTQDPNEDALLDFLRHDSEAAPVSSRSDGQTKPFGRRGTAA